MGSRPTKVIQEGPRPKYYDLREIAEEWACAVDSRAGNKEQRGRAKEEEYYLEFNYDSLKITEEEPVFEKDAASLEPESDNNIQYTTVVDEKEYTNESSLPQGTTFNAEGDLETTFSAELTRALKVDDRSSVSFTFDMKKLPEQQRLGRDVQHRVNIEEVREGKLKFETKNKLKWSASYPVNIKPKAKVTAQLLVRTKEECLQFTQEVKLEGSINMTLRRKDSNQFVRSLKGDIHVIVEKFQKEHGEMEGIIKVYNDDKNGFVRFESKGKVRFSLGVKEIMKVEEQSLKK